MTIAVYAGTFDPVTNGHLDVAVRAAKLFQKVIVGVYDLPAGKRVLFSTEERVMLFKECTAQIKNIEVVPFSGLVVDFALARKAQTIVRGLRASADFEREFEMAHMNKKLRPDLELVCLMCNLQYQFVSSSLLKEVASLGGNIDDMVPPHVATALKERLARA